MIRQAKPTDVDIIHALINRDTKHLLSRGTDDILKNIYYFVVAVEADTIIGCAGLDVYSDKICEIRSVYVEPEYRGTGLGKELIKECLKNVKEGQEVFVVTSSIGLFKNAGFDFCLGEKYILYKKKG